MLIVSDTSPITNLIKIDQLDLLKILFQQAIIPQKVYEELADYENQGNVIDSQSWIIVKAVKDQSAVERLKNILDPGEAEAIILAQELKANFLIIDERKGRKIAETRGITITGLLGVLIRAKKKEIVPKLKPLLDKLISLGGFRISKTLYQKILEEVGE